MPTDPRTAKEKADALKSQLLMSKLDSALRDIQNLPAGVNLYMPDGSPNYAAVMRVLRSDEFASFREANPDVFKSARMAMATNLAGHAASTTSEIAKLAFSLDQIRRAKRVDDRFPQPLGQQPADQALKDEITALRQEIEVGANVADQRMAQRDADLAFRSASAAGAEYSGGQAASAQAISRVAARTRQLEGNRQMIASMRARAEARARMPQLLAMRQQEIERSGRVDMFNAQVAEDRQRIVSDAKAKLMNAGFTNLFTQSDNIFSAMTDLSNQFGSQMPGYVRPLDPASAPASGSSFDPDMISSLSNVFNNPILFMNTGESLLGGYEELTAPQDDITGRMGNMGLRAGNINQFTQ